MADSDTADRKEEVPRRRRAERKVEPAAATACEVHGTHSSLSPASASALHGRNAEIHRLRSRALGERVVLLLFTDITSKLSHPHLAAFAFELVFLRVPPPGILLGAPVGRGSSARAAGKTESCSHPTARDGIMRACNKLGSEP